MLVILLSNIVIEVERVLILSKLSSELLFSLSFLELKEKYPFDLCWLSLIVMSMPSINFDAFITLAFDAYPRQICQSFI